MRITAPVTDYIKASLPGVTGDLVVRGAALMERLAAGVAGTYLQGKGAEVVPAYEKTMPPLTTKGDLIVQDTTYPARLAGGASGYYLQSQGAGEIPIYKQTMPPLTTIGDMIAQGAAVPERLPTSAVTGKVLTNFAGSFPAWISLFNLLTTKGDLWVRGTSAPQKLVAGALDTYFKGQGAGVLPIYEKLALRDTGIKIGNDTRSTAGAQAISGVGFLPSLVIFIATDTVSANMGWSVGYDTNAEQSCIYFNTGNTLCSLDTFYSIIIGRSGANTLQGNISALGSDGFTITWSLTGAVSLEFAYLCLP